MFCPSCGGEYREGFTTCADCEIPLVESLPPGGVPTPRRHRRSTRVENLFAPLGKRWSLLRLWVGVMLVWLALFVAAHGVMAASNQEQLGDWVDAASKTGVLVRDLFITLLPLACIVGILANARWARDACLVYFPIATLFQAGFLAHLLASYRQQSSLMGEPRLWLLAYAVSNLLTLIVNAVFFFLVQKRGIETHKPEAEGRAYAYGNASSS